MFLQEFQSRSLVLLFLAFLVSPASAHNVKTSEDVAATFHIEPNHNPRAGEQAQAWFALTRKGGQVIPLAQCNCKLAVYPRSGSPSSPSLLEPPLKAISAEQYQGIPGADIVFPKPGTYQLELRGTPKAVGDFRPFQLKYEVTVRAGKSTPTTTPSIPQATQARSPSPSVWQTPTMVLATLVGLGVVGFAWRYFKRSH